MHIIACIDDRDGILFGRRRVSSDQCLTQKLLSLTAGSKLWMNGYTAKLFAGQEDRILVADNYLELAQNGDYCFAETGELLAYAEKTESVLLFRWNRKYPADTHFPRELLRGKRLVSAEDFPGNSHEKITLERYAL